MNSQAQGADPIVLLYHRLGLPKRSSIVAGQYVPAAMFGAALRNLARRGWTFASLQSVLESCRSGADTRGRVSVTFDDGYLSVYERGYPILKQSHIPATVYVVAGAVGRVNDWDVAAGDRVEPMMTRRHIQELSAAGIEIGSHTMTHPRLTGLSDQQLAEELTASKHKLESIIGKEVTSFSYPYGDYDQRVVDAVKAAGYSNATCTRIGALDANVSAFEVPRINVRFGTFGPFLLRKIRRAQRAPHNSATM